MKKEKTPLVNFTMRARMQKVGIDMDSMFTDAQTQHDEYTIALAGDQTRVNAWKAMQSNVKASKILDGLATVMISKMESIQSKFNTYSGEVQKQFSPQGGIDAMVLMNATAVITNKNMTLSQIIASQDINLLRAVKVLPAGKYVVTGGDQSKMDMIETAIAKLTLGSSNFDEMQHLADQLSTMNEFHQTLTNDSKGHQAKAAVVASTMVPEA